MNSNFSVALFLAFSCVLSGFAMTSSAKAAEAPIKVGQYLREKSNGISKKFVYWGDLIETSTEESAELVLFPAFVLNLGPSSRLKIVGNLIWKKGSAVISEGSLSLLRGSLHAKLTHPAGTVQTMRVIAPKSVSSIRGTELFISAEQSSSTVFVKEGNVGVRELRPNGAEVSLAQGTGLILSASDARRLSKSPKGIVSPLHLLEVDEDWKSLEKQLIAGQEPQLDSLRSKYDSAYESAVASIEKEAADEPKKMESDFNDFMKEND